MQSDQMLGSLSFTVSRVMGNKFPLGPIKNVWEVGHYGFIEFYKTQYGTRTNFIGFKEDKSSWQPKETLEEAMLSVLPQKEKK